jgi:hypothetical protein
LPARLHRAGRRPGSAAVLILATLHRVAPAQTLPRGESGPEAGDGSVAQTCSSVLPRRIRHRFRRGSCLQKQNTGISFPSLSRSQKREDATARFGAGASLLNLLRGIPCSAYTTKYPIPTPTRPRAMAAYPVREECDERTGEYRENEAGNDRDPLQLVAWGTIQRMEPTTNSESTNEGAPATALELGSLPANPFARSLTTTRIFFIFSLSGIGIASILNF